MLRQKNAVSNRDRILRIEKSGYYQLQGSKMIPSRQYWVEVATNGRDTTLSIKDGKTSRFENGFIDLANGRPWNGFFGGELVPCCELRNLQIIPVRKAKTAIA